MSTQELLFRGLVFVLIIPAIVLHEISHGYVAFRLGDPTAKLNGRLSLNPLKHIDPFGTILLPLLMTFAFGFGFGYAKPVPINPRYFRDYRQGMFLTGIAGPFTNLALAAIAGMLVRLLLVLPESALGAALIVGFLLFAQINLVLVFFNLIPLPPLDGSRVLPLFLPDRAMVTYHKIERYGFIILFALLWLLPDLLGFDPFDWYLGVTVDPLMRLFTGVTL